MTTKQQGAPSGAFSSSRAEALANPLLCLVLNNKRAVVIDCFFVPAVADAAGVELVVAEQAGKRLLLAGVEPISAERVRELADMWEEAAAAARKALALV